MVVVMVLYFFWIDIICRKTSAGLPVTFLDEVINAVRIDDDFGETKRKKEKMKR